MLADTNSAEMKQEQQTESHDRLAGCETDCQRQNPYNGTYPVTLDGKIFDIGAALNRRPEEAFDSTPGPYRGIGYSECLHAQD
jgi:hypothetical protein